MAEKDEVRVYFERLKTRKFNTTIVDTEKFKNDDEYRKETIHLVIKELYRKIYRGQARESQPGHGD